MGFVVVVGWLVFVFVLNSSLNSLSECDFLDMRSVVCTPLIKGYVL